MGSLVNSLLFKPPYPPSPPHPTRGIWLHTSLGSEIPAVYIEREGATVTLLYSHGNAEDIGLSYAWLKRLSRDLNVHIMCYDYTGYGESSGTPSELNCYADIEAAYQYLVEELKIYPEQIVLYGRSVGSGPSCYLAKKTSKEKRPVAGLILHSPFTSVYRVVLDTAFTLTGDKFANINRAPDIKCPVCIAHGMADGVVPVEHGMALLAAIPKEFSTDPLWMKGEGHNNLSVNGEKAFMKHLNGFLDYYVLARRLYMLPAAGTSSKKCNTSALERKNKFSERKQLIAHDTE